MAKANLGTREKRLYKAVVHELTTEYTLQGNSRSLTNNYISSLVISYTGNCRICDPPKHRILVSKGLLVFGPRSVRHYLLSRNYYFSRTKV